MLKDRLRIARQARGLSLTGLAARLSPPATRTAASHWESGRTRPKRDNLLQLAEILRVRLEWLIGTSEEGGPVDVFALTMRRDLLARVEIALEAYLQDGGLVMGPQDRWEAVEAVYDWAADAERDCGERQPIRIESVRAFLRRVRRRGAGQP